MPIIDADTHVEETEGTWAYMQESEQQFRPIRGFYDPQDPSAATGSGYWLIDGLKRVRKIRKADRAEVRTALRRSYNRWLADRCGQSGGRVGHWATDLSQEMHFVERLQERVDKGEILQAAVQKITYDNPRTFYGL